MSEAVIDVEGLEKTYRFFRLSNVALRVEPGQIAGFVGPNGAGKSTTIRILMGMIRAERGSVRVLGRNPGGRAARAAFIARLQNSAIAYTLFYRYDDAQRSVAWGTDPGSLTLVSGRAQFIPLGDRATLMQYQLVLELPDYALPPWEDPFFSGNATSVVMNDFREYVIRVHRSRT